MSYMLNHTKNRHLLMRGRGKTLFVLCLALMMVSCQKDVEGPSGDASSSASLRVNIGEDIRTLDPRKADGPLVCNIMRMLYEGLTRISDDGEYSYALAEKVSCYDDGRRYTFTLRDTLWSDGTPVTAYDFEYAWKSALEPSFPSGDAEMLYVLRNGRRVKSGEIESAALGVVARDAKTLDIELEEPSSSFLHMVAHPVFFPVCKARYGSDAAVLYTDQRNGRYVTNGPFVLRQWKHDKRLVTAKNRLYWDHTSVALEGVVMTMFDHATELQMFKEGRLDWVGMSPLALTHDQCTFSGVPASSMPQRGREVLCFNTQKAPFSDEAFRSVCEKALRGEDVSYTAYAGVRMMLCYPYSSRVHGVAMSVRCMLKKLLGVEVALKAVAPFVFEKKKNDYDGDMIYSSSPGYGVSGIHIDTEEFMYVAGDRVKNFFISNNGIVDFKNAKVVSF
jgi:ABC-type oligopeptide transport system substrate-binding subunit